LVSRVSKETAPIPVAAKAELSYLLLRRSYERVIWSCDTVA